MFHAFRSLSDPIHHLGQVPAKARLGRSVLISRLVGSDLVASERRSFRKLWIQTDRLPHRHLPADSSARGTMERISHMGERSNNGERGFSIKKSRSTRNSMKSGTGKSALITAACAHPSQCALCFSSPRFCSLGSC